jgi:hypothetical protein
MIFITLERKSTMQTYQICITQTKSLIVNIEAESDFQALLIAMNEMRDNGSELTPEDFNHCETEYKVLPNEEHKIIDVIK